MTKSLRVGSRLGKYRLKSRLGEGGSAIVWRARDTVEGRDVALKVSLPAIVEEFGREAIEAEARVAAKLDHPRILAIRNADWTEGYFVIATPLARTSLDSLPRARRTPAFGQSMLDDLSDALAHAHDRGVIHRDIKPANILIDHAGHALLSDFGTARLAPARTVAATEVGTFGYMAPEQAYGRPGYASDVFSLALTAYEYFAGTLPGWPFEWPLEGDARFRKRCPEPLQRAIRSGLALDLGRRAADGLEFRSAIERALDQIDKAEARTLRSPRRKRVNPPPDPFALEAKWFRTKFGRTLEAHYDCHACDGPISESMRACPWCGTTRNSFREVTSYPIVCPTCERGVRPEWSACPTCTSGRFEANGRPIPGRSNAERTCAKKSCGTPIHRFMHYCPGCKAKVTRPWRISGIDSCRGCRWPVVSRWRFCGWCGRRNAGALNVDVRSPKS